MFKIEWFVFSDGERLPLLINNDGVPLTYITMYVMTKLRSGNSANTINNYLQDIKHLLLWEKSNGRNLELEFKSGSLLSDEDISSILDHCMIKVKAAINLQSQVVSLDLYARTLSKLESVKKQQFVRRIISISGYVSFLSHTLLKDNPKIALFSSDFERIEKQFKQNSKLNIKSLYKDSSEYSAEPKDFEKFMDVMHYKSSDNPFKNPKDKLRNYLMIAVTYWTGVRAGELLSLKIEQISRDISSTYIEVVRNQDDPNDPRNKAPVQKTLGRQIPIPSNLSDLLWFYISNVRRLITRPLSEDHQFVFVSHKGKTKGLPMSDENYRLQILGKVKSISKDFDMITRHGFRHYYNARLSDQIDHKNASLQTQICKAEEQGKHVLASQLRGLIINENKELTFRAYLNGHKSKRSGDVYLKRHSAELANEFSLALQDDYSEMLSNSDMALQLAQNICQEDDEVNDKDNIERLNNWLQN